MLSFILTNIVFIVKNSLGKSVPGDRHSPVGREIKRQKNSIPSFAPWVGFCVGPKVALKPKEK